MSGRTYGRGGVYLRGATWWVHYSVDGRQVRESSHSDQKKVATALLKRRLGEVEAGAVVVDARGVTFETLEALLERDYRLKGRRSLRRAKEAMARLRERFAGRRADRITEADLPVYQEHRLTAGAKPATVQYELRVLRRMLRLAWRQQLLRRVPHFDLPRVPNARKGFFTAEQVEGVLAKLPGPLRTVIRFAYVTGWRVPSEVLTLRWEQVDLAGGEVRLWDGESKTDEPRVFPFAQHPALDDLLHAQRKEADRLEALRGVPVPWVFHRNGKRIRNCYGAWRAACKAAGLEGRLMHDLRRSAVRNLVNAGIPEPTAMKLTGHKTSEVFRRYNIVSPVELHAAVARLAGTDQHNTSTPAAPASGAPLPKSQAQLNL